MTYISWYSDFALYLGLYQIDKHHTLGTLFSFILQVTSFCLAYEAEARHMYCFSGMAVVVDVGGVNFCQY